MAQAKCVSTIRNKLGLHARPAMAFVDIASGFKSDIRVCRDRQVVDGKSIMQMLLLAATQGAKLTIEADGPDAREACEALDDLIRNKFGEE